MNERILRRIIISTSEWCILMHHKHVTLTSSALQSNILFCFQFTSHLLTVVLVSITATCRATTESLNHMQRVQQILFVLPKFLPCVEASFFFSFASFCHVLNFSNFPPTLEASILPSPPTGFEALQEVTKACWTYHILRWMWSLCGTIRNYCALRMLNSAFCAYIFGAAFQTFNASFFWERIIWVIGV